MGLGYGFSGGFGGGTSGGGYTNPDYAYDTTIGGLTGRIFK